MAAVPCHEQPSSQEEVEVECFALSVSSSWAVVAVGGCCACWWICCQTHTATLVWKERFSVCFQTQIPKAHRHRRPRAPHLETVVAAVERCRHAAVAEGWRYHAAVAEGWRVMVVEEDYFEQVGEVGLTCLEGLCDAGVW